MSGVLTSSMDDNVHVLICFFVVLSELDTSKLKRHAAIPKTYQMGLRIKHL